MVAKLDSMMVESYRKKRGFTPDEISRLLGYKTRQGYYYMLKAKSLARVPILAKIFGVEKRDLVIIDC